MMREFAEIVFATACLCLILAGPADARFERGAMRAGAGLGPRCAYYFQLGLLL